MLRKNSFTQLVILICFIGSITGQNTLLITDNILQSGTYHWTANNVYLLSGEVVLESGGVLTIDPGTVIRGKLPVPGGEYASLVIDRGARIEAHGTEAAPIIFTAEEDDLMLEEDLLDHELRLWDGLKIEGWAKIAGEGGNDPESNSGTLRYVSIRHAGSFGVDYANESSLTLRGVGNGTTIDHLEVFYSRGRGILVEGGTVDINRLVLAYPKGVGISIRNGYVGKGQFWLGIDKNNEDFNPPIWVGALVSIVHSPPGVMPFTKPELANLTLIGGNETERGEFCYGDAFSFLNGGAGEIHNSFISGFRSNYISFENESELDQNSFQQFLDGNSVIHNNLFNHQEVNDWTWEQLVSAFFLDTLCVADPAFEQVMIEENQLTFVEELQSSCYDYLSCELDPRPSPSSPLVDGGIPLDEEGFTNVNFQGAFGPEENWAANWTALFGTDFTRVQGHIFANLEGNCTSEGAMPNPEIPITFTQGDEEITVFCNPDGYYVAHLQPGIYSVSISHNPQWAICEEPEDFVIDENEMLELDILLVPDISCTEAYVEIATDRLRPCEQSTYVVSYGNSGTIPFDDLQVVIALDEFLDYQSSSVPLLSQNGNELTFQLENLEPFSSGTFTIEVLTNCESDLGFVHCTSAEIFEPSACPGPESAQLEVNGSCDGDSVRFQITNVGDFNTIDEWHYIVIEDEIMLFGAPDDDFPGILEPGQSLELAYLANNSTFHVATDAFPGEAESHLVRSTVACVDQPNVPINSYPENDAISAKSINCVTNSGPYDPNDKIGYPLGIGDEGLTPNGGQRINYQIRFQNTGTDTAINVKIIDTLSESLDLTTFQMGVSTHEFYWTIDEDRVLKVFYDNIMLPDSFVNEPLSKGFFTFSIEADANLLQGSAICNEAMIYFDFNEPIITNETLHTINGIFGQLSNTQKFISYGVTDRVITYPQPAKGVVNFRIHGVKPNQSGECLLYDLNGKRLVRQKFNVSSFLLRTNRLKSGAYYYQILSSKGQLLGSGKLSVVK